MSKRLKSQPLADEAAFVRTVNSIAAVQASAARLIAQRDAEIVAIQNKYAEQLEPLENVIDAKLALADAYAQEHRSELLPKDKKSVELASAIFGFRTGTPSVKLASRKIDEETIVATLEANHLGAYVRTTKAIARDKILADAYRDDELQAMALVTSVGSRVILGEIGLKITQSETFFIEPKIESGETLKTAAAK